MSLNSVIDRAVSDPEFAKRLSLDFVGASREAGMEVSASEIKAFVGMHGATDEEAVQALQARISHTGLLTGVDLAGDDSTGSPASANGSESSATAATHSDTTHHESGEVQNTKVDDTKVEDTKADATTGTPASANGSHSSPTAALHSDRTHHESGEAEDSKADDTKAEAPEERGAPEESVRRFGPAAAPLAGKVENS